MTGVPQHIYSVRKVGRHLYYSDWVAGEVAVVDMATGRKVSIATNLMRPTEIIIQWDGQPPGRATSCLHRFSLSSFFLLGSIHFFFKQN